MREYAWITRRDMIWLGLAALALTLYAFFGAQQNENAALARISSGGSAAITVPLSEDGEFDFGQSIRFSVRDGAIAFIQSDCPDLLCVRTGYLRFSGQMAACLPNRVSLTVTGDRDIDAVTY